MRTQRAGDLSKTAELKELLAIGLVDTLSSTLEKASQMPKDL
jgi:hypothetical protein